MNAVEAFILAQPEERRRLLKETRRIVLGSGPAIREVIKYGVPFFELYSSFCYLNPRKDGLDVGFMQGLHLSGEHPRLERRDRKLVKSILFAWDEKDIELVLLPVLNEALLVNEWKHREPGKRHPRKKKSTRQS